MRSRWIFALTLSLSAAMAAPALAAAPGSGSADAVAAARTRGEEGLQLYQANKWAEAYEAFKEADSLYHAPTLTLYMGHCRRNQGKLLEARELYQKLASEPVPKGAPEAFTKAVASARAELESLKQNIPSVRVAIKGAPAEQTRVTIDGVEVSAADQASGKQLDPGSHEVAAEASDGASARKTVNLKAGEAASVELTLQKTLVEPPPSVTKPGSRVPAVIAFSVGGAGLVLGGVTGGLSLAMTSDIKSRCTPDGHCLKADEPKARTARTLGITSLVGLGVGGVGIVTGAILWAVRPGGTKASETASAHVEIGLGSITIGGRF